MWKVAVVLALLIVAVLAGWFFIGEQAPYEDVGGAVGPPRDELVVPPLPVAPEGAELPEALPEPGGDPPLPDDPGWVLPALNQSDPFVREQLAAVGVPESWIGQEELVRRLTTVVENAARGEYPRRQLAFAPLQSPFKVIDRDGRTFVDPVNHVRYEALVTTLESIDPRLLGRLLIFLTPLVDEALAELGASGNAKSLMAAGVLRVLSTPVVTEEVELLRPNVFYVYADPALERQGALQKLLLRAGPGNVQRVQAYVRRLAEIMGIQGGLAAP